MGTEEGRGGKEKRERRMGEGMIVVEIRIRTKAIQTTAVRRVRWRSYVGWRWHASYCS